MKTRHYPHSFEITEILDMANFMERGIKTLTFVEGGVKLLL